MRNTYGSQQGDAWLKNRVGRIPGSKLKALRPNKKGGYYAERETLLEEVITERLTGRAKDHYVSPSMQRGSSLEEDARIYYERALGVMTAPVNFVLHPKYDFTGSSPDALVDDDGVLEIKCLEPHNHVHYIRRKEIPEEYIPQIQWEMACTGRKWCDFVLYCPESNDPKARFFYRRVERNQELIDYYTAEVLKLNAEAEYFFAENGFTPIAPYPVEIITDDGEVVEEASGDVNDFMGDGYSFIDAVTTDAP